MTWRLYIVPIVHIEFGEDREFAAPAYLWGRMTQGVDGLQGVPWAWERMVWEERGIVAVDVTPAQHDILAAQAQVIAVPETVRNMIRNYLEAGNLPGPWVQTGMSYRTILRTVLNVFSFFNRYVSKGGKVFVPGVTLDTTVGELPLYAVTLLQETADEFGLDYGWVTGATTLRELLKGMADQFGDVEYQIGGVII